MGKIGVFLKERTVWDFNSFSSVEISNFTIHGGVEYKLYINAVVEGSAVSSLGVLCNWRPIGAETANLSVLITFY